MSTPDVLLFADNWDGSISKTIVCILPNWLLMYMVE